MTKILAEGQSGEIVALEAEPFDLEVKLQELIEEHPEIVLAGLAGTSDLRIWSVGFEVPTDAGSIDLLLLDSDGFLWVVETKLARNPEVKKQVVGQVLGYASCVAEWSADSINAVGTEYLASRDSETSLLEYLSLELGDTDAAHELLERTAERLAAGEMRALVVVDELPSTLQRLVEFVNNHAVFDLYALSVEVTRHRDRRLFIPTVTGATGAKAARRQPTGDVYQLIDQAPEPVRKLWELLQELVKERGWGYEPAAKSIKVVDENGRFVVRLWPTYKTLELIVGSMEDAGMEEEAAQIREQLSELIGSKLSARNPSPRAAVLVPVWEQFVAEILPRYVAARAAARETADVDDYQQSHPSDQPSRAD